MPKTTQQCSTQGTKAEIGTVYLDSATNDVLVYTGDGWANLEQFIDDLEAFDSKYKELHDTNPTLKTAWEEYKTLRRLITGE